VDGGFVRLCPCNWTLIGTSLPVLSVPLSLTLIFPRSKRCRVSSGSYSELLSLCLTILLLLLGLWRLFHSSFVADGFLTLASCILSHFICLLFLSLSGCISGGFLSHCSRLFFPFFDDVLKGHVHFGICALDLKLNILHVY